MTGFQRSYRFSVVITSVLAAGTIFSVSASPDTLWWSWIASLLVGAIPWLAILLQGGLDRHRRLAFAIAASAAFLSSILQVGAFVEFVRSGGDEGPHGEGSPGAGIAAMLLFAALITCPWIITALRGWRTFTRTPSSCE
ncbi:MAG: hypothetical protein QM755_19250 [Luteolibacter sp.]